MDDVPYLDCNATTPVCEGALRAVLAAMGCCGNASSAHGPGRAAAARVEAARESVARMLGGADPRGVVFTSGATEANNLALRGVVEAARRDPKRARPHVVTSAVEHSSVLAPLRRMAARGEIALDEAPAPGGVVRVEDVAALLRPETVLVSVQHANNEVGTVQPAAAIGDLCAERGVLYHADLCQSAGKVPLDVSKVDLASVSAHKLYGPTGVGALYARPEVLAWLEPQTLGGGQEGGRRAGTLNAHAIAGFGAACDAMAGWGEREAPRLRRLRDLLLALLLEGPVPLAVNGALDPPWDGAGPCFALRLPHNLNVTLLGVDGKAFHDDVRREVALSAGSACKALGGQRSHVLDAVGAPPDGAVVRVGLGSCNDEAQVRRAARAIIDAALRNPAAQAGGVGGG